MTHIHLQPLQFLLLYFRPSNSFGSAQSTPDKERKTKLKVILCWQLMSQAGTVNATSWLPSHRRYHVIHSFIVLNIDLFSKLGAWTDTRKLAPTYDIHIAGFSNIQRMVTWHFPPRRKACPWNFSYLTIPSPLTKFEPVT